MRLMVREGYRLVRRDWRSRELRILALALIVAVATVTAITVFSAKLQQMIYQSSSQFLAGDRQLSSPNPIDPLWLLEAKRRGLSTASTLEFPSHLSAPRITGNMWTAACISGLISSREVRITNFSCAHCRPLWIRPTQSTLL